MSGGHFDYKQYVMNDISSELEKYIDNIGKKDEWGHVIEYSPEIVEKFKIIKNILDITRDLVHHTDWLISGDTGEDKFIKDTEESFKLLTILSTNPNN